MIQVHGKFKLFATDFSSDTDLHDLLGRIEDWVKEKKGCSEKYRSGVS